MKGLCVMFMLVLLLISCSPAPNENNHDHKSAFERVKQSTTEGASGSVERVKEAAEGVNSKFKDVYEETKGADLDTPKRAVEDIERNISTGLGSVKDFVQRVIKGGVHKIKDGEEWKQVYSKDWKNSMLEVFHLLALSIAFGMSMWMRFVSCYILGDVLPRQQFAMVETKMYPVYFRIEAYCIGTIFIAHLWSHGSRVFANWLEVLHALNIVLALFMSMGNLLYLEPLATRVSIVHLLYNHDNVVEILFSHLLRKYYDICRHVLIL